MGVYSTPTRAFRGGLQQSPDSLHPWSWGVDRPSAPSRPTRTVAGDQNREDRSEVTESPGGFGFGVRKVEKTWKKHVENTWKTLYVVEVFFGM